jgi:hypothetical protein
MIGPTRQKIAGRHLHAAALALCLILPGIASSPAAAFPLFQSQSEGAEVASASTGQWLRLKWEDLIPAGSPLKNPVLDLKQNQVGLFYTVQYWRTFFKSGMATDPALYAERDNVRKDAEDAERRLTEQGIDANKLVDSYSSYQQEVDRRGRATKGEYNGKLVAIAGYLLPLDFNDEGVKEFLLVPNVGACIHVPPPPPNQVVYVKTERPYIMADIFDSVLVTGTMRVASVSKNLSLVDGANQVDAGYSVKADSIEAYRETTPEK